MEIGGTLHSRRQAMVLAAALFAGGAVLTLVALAAPRSPNVDVAGSWAVALASAVVAAAYWLGRDALPVGALYAGIALGTVMIAFGIYINGERDGGAAALNEIYFVWPVVFAAYYFPLRALILELALVAVTYAVALQLVDAGPIAPTRWLIVVTMLAGVGGLIWRLQARLSDLVDQLSENARRDVLTGLLNRRGFEERLDAELARATRGGRTVALVLGDVDRFKDVNDRLGHPPVTRSCCTSPRFSPLSPGAATRWRDSGARSSSSCFPMPTSTRGSRSPSVPDTTSRTRSPLPRFRSRSASARSSFRATGRPPPGCSRLPIAPSMPPSTGVATARWLLSCPADGVRFAAGSPGGRENPTRSCAQQERGDRAEQGHRHRERAARHRDR